MSQSAARALPGTSPRPALLRVSLPGLGLVVLGSLLALITIVQFVLSTAVILQPREVLYGEAMVYDHAARLLQQASQRSVGDLDVGPEPAPQHVLADDPPALLEQQEEQIQHERLDADGPARTHQRTRLAIELAVGPTESQPRCSVLAAPRSRCDHGPARSAAR